MAWIEVHQGLLRHRKISALARLLDVRRTSATGHMVALWLWALDNAPDGDLTHIEPDAIAIGAEWEDNANTFMEALITSGFVDAEPRRIHHWYEYAGKLIDRRKADAERKRKSRESVQRTSSGRPMDVTRTSASTVPYPTLPLNTERERDAREAVMNDGNCPEWLGYLRDLDEWDKKGASREPSLLKWVLKKGHTEDQLEAAAIGLGKVKDKTLKGYSRLDRAFQDRLNKGYDNANPNHRTKQTSASDELASY